MVKSLPFVKRIESHYEQLSPNARRIANYLQQNPLDVLNTSVAEIADITQTSKATVSRFFRQLGYDSHQDVKKELRTLRAAGYPLPMSNTDNNYVNQEMERISQTWDTIKTQDIDCLVDSIVSASRITLIGYRNSYPVALHFRQQLLQLRDKVRILPQPGQSIGEEIQDLSKDELVIIVGFRRRPKIVGQLVNKLQNSNVVLLADPSAQIYRSKVSQLLICQLGQELPLDSYAAPMSVISVICNAVMTKLKSSSTGRIKAISSLYQELEELE